MRKITLFVLIFMCLVACDKPNHEPEKLDPIYSLIEKEVAEAESAIKKTEGELAGFEKDLKAVAPQSGQIKFAEKRVYETKSKLEKINQMKKYWELRLASRKAWAREHYLKAYNKKEPWPDPKEYEEYEMQRKMELASRTWNAKARLQEAGIEIPGNQVNLVTEKQKKAKKSMENTDVPRGTLF